MFNFHIKYLFCNSYPSRLWNLPMNWLTFSYPKYICTCTCTIVQFCTYWFILVQIGTLKVKISAKDMYIRYLFCSFKRSNTLSLKVQTKFPRIHFLCPSCLQTQQKLENKIHEYKAHIPYVLDMIIISQPTISDLHSQSYGGLIGPAPGHVSDGVPSPSQQQ